MRNIKAVFKKQMLSFFKNPAFYGAPFFFLLLPLLFIILIPGAAYDRAAIVSQFVTIFIGISMIGTAAGFIAEDRSTMNLRFMSMAGVKPHQYLIGSAGALLIISLGANVYFGLLSGHSGHVLLSFLSIAMLGVINSLLLGITFGLSRLANFTMVVALVLGIGSVFSDINETLSRIFYFTFTHQVNTAVRGDLSGGLARTYQMLLINMAVLLVLFLLTNIRSGLDGDRVPKKGK